MKQHIFKTHVLRWSYTYRLCLKCLKEEDGPVTELYNAMPFFCWKCKSPLQNEDDLKCPMCLKEYKQRANFVFHLQKHFFENVCNDCVVHLNSFEEARKYFYAKPYNCVCCVCKEKRITPKNLNVLSRHYDFHYCDQMVMRLSQNATRTRNQNNQKNLYFCTTCNKSFTYKSSAERHQLVHSKEKRWKCSGCEKSYKEKQSLDRHAIFCRPSLHS